MVSSLTFVAVLALGIVLAPVTADAQPVKTPRIGLLSVNAVGPGDPRYEAFVQGLRDHGWGPHSYVIERRDAAGRFERLRERAAEVVRLKVDVILAVGRIDVDAVLQSTRTIPVVTVYVNDPIMLGYTTSLARPSGNVTGFTLGAVYGKRLELLKELVPGLSQVALLWDLAVGPPNRVTIAVGDATLQALGLTLHPAAVREGKDVELALTSARRAGVRAVIFGPDTFFLRTNVAMVAASIIRHQLPAIAERELYAQGGLLASYGPDAPDLFRRAANYVNRVLRGAAPAELPFQQPTTFKLAVNLKTARALGLTIPPSVLLRADRVIE